MKDNIVMSGLVGLALIATPVYILFLLLFSYLILFAINYANVNIDIINIPYIKIDIQNLLLTSIVFLLIRVSNNDPSDSIEKMDQSLWSEIHSIRRQLEDIQSSSLDLNDISQSLASIESRVDDIYYEKSPSSND